MISRARAPDKLGLLITPDSSALDREQRTKGARLDLTRFLDAQGPVIDAVMAELDAGEKRTHWMWFIFPQLRALGRSSTARFYGIESADEARAYLAQPVLSERLKACTRAVLEHHDRTANALFGSPDDLKFRSSMTLFSIAAPEEPLFRQALQQFFDGRPDPLTVQLCAATDGGGR